ncbi:RNA-binding transcriptional accessory protein OS=Streptomyces microflavus OX=1919 GN=G3I39_17180 PE=4 SV=1 [Streptomyces microflavus]
MPGRDRAPAARAFTARSASGFWVIRCVEKLGDLEPGMVLEGVVTNVAAFGAFVDIGVHQDGLVHVSALSKTFVKDPRDVVKPGDIVKVKVMDVDIPRKRISLSLRLDDEPGAGGGSGGGQQGRGERGARPPKQRQGQGQGSGGGQARQGGQGGGRDRRGGSGGGGSRQGQGAPAPANSAMADALRRAGLTDPKQGGRGR